MSPSQAIKTTQNPWHRTCPQCLHELWKDDPLAPWVCPRCNWRSDKPINEGPKQSKAIRGLQA